MPVVSVVSWEVRESVCEPYTVKALVSCAGPVSRVNVLGQLAAFSVEPEDGRGRREFRGVVTRFDSVSSSRDEWTYRVVVRQRLSVLDGPSNCAVYQNKTSWEIVKDVFERNDARPWMQLEFRLHREHPRHAFRFQYNMGDWEFIRLEMEQAGLCCFTRMGEHGEVLVVTDEIDGYERPAIVLSDRPLSGLSTFEESIYAIKLRTRTVPASFVVADFNPEAAWTRFRHEDRVGREDPTMIGAPYVWGTHHGDADAARREARLRHEAARARQVRFKVRSTALGIRPGCIVRPDPLPDEAPEGMAVIRVVHRGARNASYTNRFTAIPADRPYRMPIDEARWPKIHGTLGATITSPDDYKFAYLTEKGEYIARFHCDFGNWPKGGESVPLRLAKPFAGKDHTGLHLPAVDGDEALVGFREGNPNKPVILGFMHNSEHPDLINTMRRRFSRNEIRTQSGNKLWMDDWDHQEGIELATEHSGRSQLSLGYIPDGELKERGAGAELRTSGHLVHRGGAGVMVSAYDQPGGSGKVLAMDETHAQLNDHQAMSESLAASADASKATPADTLAQKAIHDGLHELKQPGVLVTAPGPVGLVSGDGVQLAADGSIIGTAKKGIHFGTLKRLTAAARDRISLFAQKGMSLITSAGDFVAQAQRGRMQLAAQSDMTVETVDGVLHVKSKKEIVLNCGGSYIRIAPDGIEMGTRGAVRYRCAKLGKTGPAQMDLGGVAFSPKLVPYTTECEIWRTNANFVEEVAGTPVPDQGRSPALANIGPVAPAAPLDAGSMSSAGSGSTQRQPFLGATVSAGGPTGNAGLVINDPDNEQQIHVSPDPVQLQTAAPCNWQLPDFTTSASMKRETPRYHKYGWTRTERLMKEGQPVMCSGTATTTCQFSYDAKNKRLTAKVTIALVPRLLIKLDPVSKEPLRDDNNGYVVEQYETFENGANSTKPFSAFNLKQIDRDAKEIDASTYKKQIESTLNQGNYKLILGGCQKDAACGCRVSVKFCVDVHVVTESAAAALNPDITINLFPTTARADAKNWPEFEYESDDDGKNTSPKLTQVKAHEAGHLFNFPDEYWAQGGFVHSIYVKNDLNIDFERADANKRKNNVWVIESESNLMGGGCNKPAATIPPYYLDYIRGWFSVHTGKLWRIGYEATALPRVDEHVRNVESAANGAVRNVANKATALHKPRK